VEPEDRRIEPDPAREPGPVEPVDRPAAYRERYAEESTAQDSDSQVVARFSPARRAFELIYLVFALICALIIIRIVLKVLAANTAVAFTSFVYGVTNFLMAPFNGLLPTFVSGRTILEGSAIIALGVYALIGYLLARLVSIFFLRDVSVAHSSRGRYRTY
jgi:YggT family protein